MIRNGLLKGCSENMTCNKCGSSCSVHPCGDWKQYYAVWCDKCGYTDVTIECSRYTIDGAIKVWKNMNRLDEVMGC